MTEDWRKEFNRQWAEDDVPRLRKFAVEFISTLLADARADEAEKCNAHCEKAVAEERERVRELVVSKLKSLSNSQGDNLLADSSYNTAINEVVLALQDPRRGG